jgi:iron(III) transport system substrate-binding protein
VTLNAPSSTRAAVTALIAVLLAFPAHAKDVAKDVVNVYSYRQPFLITPMFDAFTRETGISVNVVHAKKGLVERLEQEGANSPADLIFTVDIGRLTDAARAGVTQPVTNAALEANIPAQYRDPDHHWFGLTTRARIIVASKDRVAPGAITSYEDLADPMWKGRICTRSGKHAYMVALTAAMIAHHGEAKAEEWLRGVKANLARRPQGNDRAQVKAIMEGVCDVAVINHYYMGKMINDEKQAAWAASVNIVFPNQQSYGTHMNVSGMALTRSAPNRDNAVKLMVFLSDDLAQQMYAEQNFEYPVKQGVPWSGLLRSFGDYKADDLGLAEVARYRKAASKLADKVGFDT